MRMCAKGVIESPPVPLDGGAGVDITGRADRRRNIGDGHRFGIQATLAIFKMIHDQGFTVEGCSDDGGDDSDLGKYSGPF